MEQSTPKNTELDEGLGWDTAHELLRPFGKVASNFTEATRTLINAHESGCSCITDTVGASHVLRLIQADSIKVTYYYFSKQFRPSLFEGKRGLTTEDFLTAFSPIEHAAILAFCYLFKTISQKIEKDEWEFVQTPLYEALCTGGGAGICIDEIGLGLGLISRGIRYLAYAPFLYENRKEFKQYRRHLKSIDKPFDTTFEQDVWRCSSIQIASILLENMGFPPKMVHQYGSAAARSRSVEPDKIYGIPLRLAECLVAAYMEGEEIPTITPAWTGIKLELDTETRANLRSTLNKVFSDSLPLEWLNKTSANINPDETPELFYSTDKGKNESANGSGGTGVPTERKDATSKSGVPSASAAKDNPVAEQKLATSSITEEAPAVESQNESVDPEQEGTIESSASEKLKATTAPSSEVTDALDSLNDLDES